MLAVFAGTASLGRLRALRVAGKLTLRSWIQVISEQAKQLSARLRGGVKKLSEWVEERAQTGKNAVKKGSLVIEEGGNLSASEIKAAQHMRDLGHDVILRKPRGTRAAGETSDLLVDGVRVDVYTPKTGNPDRIVSAIAKKNTQATKVIVDLSETTVTREQLGNVFQRVRGSGATNIDEVIIID